MKKRYQYYTGTGKEYKHILWRREFGVVEHSTTEAIRNDTEGSKWSSCVDFSHEELNTRGTKSISRREAEKRFPNAFPGRKLSKKTSMYRYYKLRGSNTEVIWRKTWPGDDHNPEIFHKNGKNWLNGAFWSHAELASGTTERITKKEARKLISEAFPRK